MPPRRTWIFWFITAPSMQTGDVWCTGQNMFQESMGLGEMILELHTLLTDPNPQNLTYLHRLR